MKPLDQLTDLIEWAESLTPNSTWEQLKLTLLVRCLNGAKSQLLLLHGSECVKGGDHELSA